jgi:hypothetical protein
VTVGRRCGAGSRAPTGKELGTYPSLVGVFDVQKCARGVVDVAEVATRGRVPCPSKLVP